MNSDLSKLYFKDSTAEEAFLLEKGSIYFYLSEDDKYSLSGNNLIIGSTELLLNSNTEIPSKRLETALTTPETRLKKISKENLKEGMKKSSFICNICMVLSKQITLVNGIISKNSALLDGNEKEIEKISVEYFHILEKIRDEYNKRKFPWLKEVLDHYSASLLYKRGQSFSRNNREIKISPSEALNDQLTEYSSGTIICKEGEAGSEMYILNSGTIDIIIGENKIASIEEPGTPIGEMSLFIGETRSATLIAKNNVIVTKIKKTELKNVFEKDPQLFYDISNSLATKYYNSIQKLNQINKKLIEKNVEEDSEKRIKNMQKKNSLICEYNSLEKNIIDLNEKYQQDFLKKIIDSF